MFGGNIHQFVITNNLRKDPCVINRGFIDKFNRNKFLDKHNSDC